MVNDDMIMPWGKYKGKPMYEVPDSYLLWLHENHKDHGTVSLYIANNLAAIKANVKREKR